MSSRKNVDESAEEIPHKQSKTRQEIEALLKEKGFNLERRLSVIDLASGETWYFDCYPDALEFLKGRKGKWFVTASGISSIMDVGKR